LYQTVLGDIPFEYSFMDDNIVMAAITLIGLVKYLSTRENQSGSGIEE